MEHSMSQYVNKAEMLREVMAENERLKAQLAAAQQGAQDAEPAAWVATFKPEGLLALHSVVGANLEELKQSVPGNSVFRPLYTHPATQGLDAQATRYQVGGLTVEWRGNGKWAVVDGCSVLSRNGEWKFEPSPSSRTDELLAMCRFDSAQEAITAAKAKQGGAANG